MNAKRFTALVLSAMLALSTAACGLKPAVTEPATSAGSPVTVAEPTPTPAPTPTPTPEPKGNVYYLNAEPENDAVWQKLAADYTAQTGVNVRVVSVTENYQETVSNALDSADAPTMFAVTKGNLPLWQESCLDLRPAKFLQGIVSEDLTIKDDNGKVLAAGYDFDCWGLLVNKNLLEQAGYSVDQIKNYDSFSFILDRIQERRYETGVGGVAFELTEDTWHYTDCLMNAPLYYEFHEDGITKAPGYLRGSYLDQLRYLWDSLIDHCASSVTRYHVDTIGAGEVQREIGENEAVFAICTSNEIGKFTDEFSNDRSNFSMIPLYGGFPNEENAGLSCGNIRYWCVNREADDLDIQATLDFLAWLTTDASAAAALVEANETLPYVSAPEGKNPCLNAANAYFKKGCFNVSWYYEWIPGDEWRTEVLRFLKNYTLGQNAGENMWFNVTEAIRNNWQTVYQMHNS